SSGRRSARGSLSQEQRLPLDGRGRRNDALIVRPSSRGPSMKSFPKALAVLASAACLQAAWAAGPAIDTATIESVTGLKGTYNKTENVFKVSKPRDDVKISVDRWTMPAFMGLTSWAAFTPMG